MAKKKAKKKVGSIKKVERRIVKKVRVIEKKAIKAGKSVKVKGTITMGKYTLTKS